MTEEQQIEIWRKEYFKLTGEMSGHSAKWAGFLLAKRSMPVIELPEFFDDPDGCQLFSGSVTGAIEAAGYKYKIKL